MSVKLFGRICTGRQLAEAIIERFEDEQIEFDFILRKVHEVDVYDMCYVCRKPVLRTDEYVSKGFLTGEHLVHKTCNSRGG